MTIDITKNEWIVTPWESQKVDTLGFTNRVVQDVYPDHYLAHVVMPRAENRKQLFTLGEA